MKPIRSRLLLAATLSRAALLLLAAAPLSLAVATAVPAAAAPEPAVWPLTPRPPVVRGFDLPAEPWLPGHRGVDLSGSPGQQVRSATSGTVTYAGRLAGRGVVVVSTGPRRTTYEPVVPAVRVGTAVQPGSVIGRLSAAGSHCAPATCLHWGLVEGKQYLNPLTLLPDRPVRLLPHTLQVPHTLQARPQAPNDRPQPLHAGTQAPRSTASDAGAENRARQASDGRPEAVPPPPEPALAEPALAESALAEPAPSPAGASKSHALTEASTPPRGERSGAAVATTVAATEAPRGGRAAAAVVATTAALTVAAGLLIRRH